MSENKIQNPDSFEICVAKKFKHLIDLENLPFSQSKESKQFKGNIYSLFFKILAPLERKALKEEAKHNNYKEFDKKADELLIKQEIRQNICERLRFEGSREIITPEKFGEIITNSLNDKSFTEKFDYPIDHILFAFVAYKVHKVGLQKFCDNVEKETQ